MRILEERRKAIIAEMEAGCGSEQVFSYPISLEPPFKHFSWTPGKGDERVHLSGNETAGGGLHFIRVKPSKEDKNSLELAERLILSLPSWGPVSFEVITRDGKIGFQLAVNEKMAQAIISQTASHFPYADIFEDTDLMVHGSTPLAIARAYRLRNTHFLPLNLHADGDPYRTLFGCLGDLGREATGALQVLFMPVAGNWQDNMRRASHDPYDRSRSPFVDLPQLPKGVEKKLAKPLFAASLRMLASSRELLEGMEMFLKQFESADNGISPIGSYPVESILARNTFVHGAILNATELSYFIHLPAPEVMDSAIGVEKATKSYVVAEDYTSSGPVLGYNLHRGIKRAVCHSRNLPNQHTFVMGASGRGKSCLTLLAIMQRINQGQGIALIDLHGSLVKDVALRIPKERKDDVIYFHPDVDHPIAINPLANGGSRQEKELSRVDIMDFLKDIFETMGVSINHCLNFCLVTLQRRNDSTFGDIERLLIDKIWRAELLRNERDERIRIFWEYEFPQLERKGIVTAICNKLSPFILPESAIAPMLSQRENKLNFLEIINGSKIFLCNLSIGAFGRGNAQLLGKLLVSRFQIAAMMREGMESYPDYFLYIDEFPPMCSPSMAEILHGTRKYGLHLWLANQATEDIPDYILRHLFNSSALIFFGTDSPHDRTLIEKTVYKKFTAEDIGGLKRGETIVKMDGSVFNMTTERVPEPPPINYVEEIIALSREKYTTARTATAEKKSRKALALSASEKTFLKCALQNPTLSVTALYKEEGLSGYMGDKLKNALKGKGLLREVTTHLGAGSRITKFLFLTPEGFNALDMELGPENGKGGQLHRYWQSIVKLYAEANGYRVTIEDPIPGSKETVDLGFKRGGKRTAIEISIITDAENETDNIKKCLKAGYDKIVVLVLEEEKAKAIETLAKRTLTAEELNKVSFGLVYGFGGFC